MLMNVFDKAPFCSFSRVFARLRPGDQTMPPPSLDAGLSGANPMDQTFLAELRQSGGRSSARPLGGWVKRTIDFVIAFIALVLALPIMLLIAALIRLTMGGPVIFSHPRVGYRGETFHCYKFRTMVLDADRALSDLLSRDPVAAREWEEFRKISRDPRITWLGHVLRKSSLDELPQLINILRGDMSCVGPRPVVSDELSRYGASAEAYLSTRPGLTGLWQVSGRSSTDFSRRICLDSQYVQEWSLLVDLNILARTTFVVIRMTGVH